MELINFFLMDFFMYGRWFVKRFFYFDVVVFYEYIFVWDEDLGVENFDFME